ncbi:heparan-alpha-glucosaminide N-acetyltransferase domain-containing protein [uncultured Paracoccus sp.]|uniref:DUF1624 domain-containing protein n=1 Tax=uncultured Paracoccus sp. TaxID=189685 RepID=UPI002619279A|nr:heparan-alpha-glucosaminide N-acetyltransferase domain-containing protein [uncultured Paracoccus sp.]
MTNDPGIVAGVPHRYTGARVASIDLLRGLIMALMALDHTRAFILGFTPDPTDIDTTTVPLFATRWITHLCAPGFLLLAGVAARLQRERRDAGSLALLLATRGAFLIALELTIIGFAWIPDPSRSLMLLQVIWAIGWSMLLLAPLVFLPAWGAGAIGVALSVLHPMLSAGLAGSGAPTWAGAILFDANTVLEIGGMTRVIVSYPILPWFGVMAAGYALGDLVLRRPDDWAARITRLGLALLAGFVVLRASRLGLDPEPWRTDLSTLRSAMSFLNCEKYPPSPLFLMMTLGPLLLLLALFERFGAGHAEWFLRPLGQAPLFFYVLHLYALRIVGLATAVAVWGVEQFGPPPLHSAPGGPLWAVWLVWIIAMTALYPPTRWFAEFKTRRRTWWSRYL